jgi:predicted TIM-barrel fold metal-dependent hydrolase
MRIAMQLEEHRPRSMLILKETVISHPRYPVVDAHNHLFEPFGDGWERKPFPELLERLDQAGVRLYVDLDGGWGEEVLNEHLDLFKARAPERFKIFGGVDWSYWLELGTRFPEWAAGRLRAQKERGAEGLKIWKPFGLKVQDERGALVRVDDPRLDPIWETAAELHLPVLIHVADPVAFFQPLDAANERWEELHAHPDWHFPSPPYPSFLSILEGLANLIGRHPSTTFIAAHVGCYAENLAWVSDLLERCPNLYVDISARIAELGRQPYTARRFFLHHADRILFGLDLGPDVEAYRIAYRFLESDDEYFNYDTREIPSQGRWRVCGLFLPDDVLAKVYYRNAGGIFGTEFAD